MSFTPLKIFIHTLDATGQQNACVGLAQALAERGHQIMFLLNAAFKGQFTKFGFEEILLEKPTSNQSQAQTEPLVNPVKQTAEMFLKSGTIGKRSPLEKLKDNFEKKRGNTEFIDKIYQTTVDFSFQIEEAFNREKPHMLILGHFFVPPVVLKSGVPWVYLFSPNPLALFNSTKLPPFGSGYPVNTDPSTWDEYRNIQAQMFETGLVNFSNYQKKLNQSFNYESPENDFPYSSKSIFPKSKFLNVYGFPKELDYSDVVPIGDEFFQVDMFCLKSPEVFQLPEGFPNQGDKLIYFSLGSMGSIDVELMKRIVAVLGKTPYKYIVSKGPLADEYDLPENCWGKGYLPQTQLLPLVDLVINHGGNNTVTETFTFGKPMIVMPLFGDQYDNAQRVHEKGYGVRIDPYDFDDQDLLDAIERLLNDEALKQRLQVAASRMENDKSKEKFCDGIEKLVIDNRNN